MNYNHASGHDRHSRDVPYRDLQAGRNDLRSAHTSHSSGHERDMSVDGAARPAYSSNVEQDRITHGPERLPTPGPPPRRPDGDGEPQQPEYEIEDEIEDADSRDHAMSEYAQDHDGNGQPRDIYKSYAVLLEVVDMQVERINEACAKEERHVRELAEARARAKAAEQHLAAARQKEKVLKRAIADGERRLASVANDLANMRALTGDSADEQALETLFGDVNDAVADAAFRLVTNLKDDVEHIHRKRLQRLGETEELKTGISQETLQFISPYLQYCRQEHVEGATVILNVAQAVIHRFLDTWVFRPFEFRHAKLSGVLLDIEQKVQSHESQMLSARWRSITYNALQRECDTDDNEALASEFATEVKSFIASVLSVIYEPTLLVDHYPALEKSLHAVALLAFRWQDIARGIHQSYDFATFLPSTHTLFAVDEMADEGAEDRKQALSSSATVLLPLAMGLKSARSDAQNSSSSSTGIARTVKVRQKAVVIVSP